MKWHVNLLRMVFNKYLYQIRKFTSLGSIIYLIDFLHGEMHEILKSVTFRCSLNNDLYSRTIFEIQSNCIASC